MTYRESVLCVIVGLVIIVGIPFIKRNVLPAQAEQIYFQETEEYKVAKKLASSNLKLDCYKMKVLWQALFPEKNCWRYKTNIGTYHWYCEITDNLFLDANYDLRGTIRIFQK